MVVPMLNDTRDPKGWGRLRVGAERGVKVRASSGTGHKRVAETLGMAGRTRGGKWCTERGTYKTVYLASLDGKTAFYVGKPGMAG